MQFKCVCKSWKSQISNDPKFAKKHLHLSNRHHLIVNPTDKCGYWNSPLSSVFNTLSKSIISQTKVIYPSILNSVSSFNVVGSCHGIICVQMPHYVLFWNPSIQKLKISPILDYSIYHTTYGFGYDYYNDIYKVVAIFRYDGGKTKVNVHTMGTNCWRKIPEFPYGVPVRESGKFVGGAVNWLACENGLFFVVSLNLRNESYQKILQPDYGDVDVVGSTLGELRGCLCIFAHGMSFVDVWVMKEYGNKESWNKLFAISFIEDLGFYPCTKVSYIYEDEQVLLVSRDKYKLKPKLVVYDSKSRTFKLPIIENINSRMDPAVYVESLITCS